MRELVFVHGRSQQGKDSVALKKLWLDTLNKGLAKNGLKLPIPEDQVRFPYYGDTLHDLVSGLAAADAAKVIIRGPAGDEDPELRAFIAHVLEEVADQQGVTEEQKLAEAHARGERGEVVERGPLNWGWVQALLSAIDRHVPGASSRSIATFTRDVYLYLKNRRLRRHINDGVREAMTSGAESVVVSHSLGTVVSYWMFVEEGEERGWKVPLYVTLGSPLAVTAIKQTLRQELRTGGHPPCVGKWFNAMDPDDIVSLYPLDGSNFPVDPAIENKVDVENQTENQHGIGGYLNDKEVAKRIYDALVAE